MTSYSHLFKNLKKQDLNTESLCSTITMHNTMASSIIAIICDLETNQEAYYKWPFCLGRCTEKYRLFVF